MAVRKVLRMGHPILRQQGRRLGPEELGSPELRRLIEDMVDTLHDYGGVGLAAPQVGESIQLAIIEIDGGPSRYGEIPPLPLTVFINPRITVRDPVTKGYWEGCLSIPGLRGFVERPQHVSVDFTKPDGDECTLELTGFLATVVQHELDHLAGTLYVDRMADIRLLAFEQEFERFLVPEED